jgi:hypothetical protein
MTSPSRYSEPSNIITFTIYPHSGSSKEMRQTVIGLDYYESILENYVHMTAILVDLEGSFQSLKLTGSEKVEVLFEDNYKQRLVFEEFYINRIHNVFSHTQRTSFMLDLVSKESLINEHTLVYDGYTGKLSQSIENIIKTKLKSSKKINSDETANAPNFNGDGKKPFRLCTEMAKKAVPANAGNKTAGYLFFETFDGYNFRSIDKLFDDSARKYKSYIYNLTTGLPNGYDGKILSYQANKTINVQERLMMGAYGAKLNAINPYSDTFDTNFSVESKDQKSLGGNDDPVLNSVFDTSSRVFYKKLDIGVMPNGSTGEEQLKGQTKENFKTSDILIQSAMRYNQIFTLILSIVIPGDVSHRAGDLIHCDFPDKTNTQNNTQIDKEISGIYMISDICYHITPTNTYTKMNLIRDSYGRKPKA